jgi:predicted dehydrogenase
MIQVAIIGCGVIGPVHAAAVRLHAGAEVRWACDRELSKARERVIARHTTTDAAEVLCDPAVDLVCICTEHPQHADIAVAALAAGKHVVCEKPLASTPADLARMCAVAASRPRQVAAGIFQHRYAPLVRRLREVIAEGGLGAIRQVAVRFACTRNEAYFAAGAWRGTRLGEGGGVAINQAIHTLDLALWLAGLAPATVRTDVCRRRLACIEVETRIDALFTLRDGTPLRFTADNDGVTDWMQDIRIEGTAGAVHLGNGHRLRELTHPSAALRQELTALDAGHLDALPLTGAKDVYGYHHAVQLGDVIDAIATGRLPRITFHDAAVANACVLAAYHSAATGAPSPVPPPHDYSFPILPLENA